MERLWTPWRRPFIEGTSSAPAVPNPTCFLCEAAGAEDDRGHLVVHRAEHVYVLLNRYPYNTAHVMVAPYAHTGDFARLETAVAHELMRVSQRAVQVISQVYRPEAFNLGMNLGRVAGAGVPDHLHVHVVPRWGGDTNFMPIVADTKVLPETLDQTFDRLAVGFQS